MGIRRPGMFIRLLKLNCGSLVGVWSSTFLDGSSSAFLGMKVARKAGHTNMLLNLELNAWYMGVSWSASLSMEVVDLLTCSLRRLRWSRSVRKPRSVAELGDRGRHLGNLFPRLYGF